MFKSISTQTGNYSYSTDIIFNDISPFRFGFSGDSKLFSFSGQSGKIYDNEGNFFYSYDIGETVNISGNRHATYNNYFVNGPLFNSDNSQDNGYLESFFIEGPISGNISFDGVSPDFIADSGVIVGSLATGLFDVFNTSASPINFKIYSGNFIGASGSLFSFSYPFDSGDVTTSKSFEISSFLSAGSSGIHPVSLELYTNFGLITKNVDILSLFALESFFSLSGPSLTTETGNYEYLLNYDLVFGNDKSAEPYSLNLQLNSISGFGDFASFTGGTGFYTGTSLESLDLTGTIINSGLLTGLYTGVITGNNPFLNDPFTGIVSVILSSGVFATGDFDFQYSILSTGLVSGNITNEIEAPYDQFGQVYPIGFTGELEVGLHTVSGTGNLAFFTGRSFFNGEFLNVEASITGVTTGEIFSSGTTGTLNGTGIESFSSDYSVTGVSGVSYSYSYISEADNVTGYFNESVLCTGDLGIGYPVSNYNLTGNFHHEVDSEFFNFLDTGINEILSINGTGNTYFTGDFAGSGTGVFIGQCSGNGYTGMGVIGSFEPFDKSIVTGNELLGFAYKEISSNRAVPLSGIYDIQNPINISGNTGIALVCDYTSEIAPIFSFAGDDGSRANYTEGSVALKYYWMNPAVSKGELEFSVSPRYYASGTGVYRESLNVGGAITLYEGDYPNMSLKEIDADGSDFWDATNSWNASISTKRIVTNSDSTTGDYIHFLINRENDNTTRPSGFYYVYWQDNSPFQANTNKEFNSFLSDDNFVALADYSGFIVSEESSSPTGEISEGFLYREESFLLGYNSLTSNITSTGNGNFSGDYGLQASDPFEMTGSFTGILTETGYYDLSTGHSLMAINTGAFDSDVIYLNYIRNLSVEDNPTVGSFSEISVANYTIGASYPTVESISGDIESRISELGYSLFLNDPILNISGLNTQYIKFGFGLNTNSIDGSISSYDINNNLIENPSGVVTGHGFESVSNFNTTHTGDLIETGFISGQWIARDDITGYLDVPTSGVYAIVDGTFTGQTLATGSITGLFSTTIFGDSGSFQTSNQETGNPISFGLTPPAAISDAIATSAFTGFLNELFEGSGDYSAVGLFDLVNSGFSMDIPTHIKTFTGEYKFLTGVDTGNLIEIPYNSSITGYESGIIITGQNTIAVIIQKTYYDSDFPDVLQIFHSGENGVTGGLDIL